MSELTPIKGSPEPGTKQQEAEVAKQQDESGDTESSPKPDDLDPHYNHIFISVVILSTA